MICNTEINSTATVKVDNRSDLEFMKHKPYSTHDDVIKWKHYWPPMNSPHKGQWRRALMFSLICAWINGWVNNREAGDLRRQCAQYDVTIMLHWRSMGCLLWVYRSNCTRAYVEHIELDDLLSLLKPTNTFRSIFIKQQRVSPPNLTKSRSHNVWIYICPLL